MRKYSDPISQNKFGLANIIRKAYKMPQWLPINAELQHGWTAHDFIFLNSDKNNIQLVWSKRIARILSKNGFKKYFIIPNPFISYRIGKYNKCENASGTVFFPQHTDEGWEATYDVEQLLKLLLELPEYCHPLTVCLYYFDYINENLRKQFEKYFKVVTAGNIYNPKFIDRFYNILRIHKYSSSNVIGTYTFYSIELGIPFFVINHKWGHFSKTNADERGMGSDDYLEQFPVYAKAHKLFSINPPFNINDRQRQYVDAEMGLREKKNTLIKTYLLINGLKLLIITFINSLFSNSKVLADRHE